MLLICFSFCGTISKVSLYYWLYYLWVESVLCQCIVVYVQVCARVVFIHRFFFIKKKLLWNSSFFWFSSYAKLPPVHIFRNSGFHILFIQNGICCIPCSRIFIFLFKEWYDVAFISQRHCFDAFLTFHVVTNHVNLFNKGTIPNVRCCGSQYLYVRRLG